MYGIILYNDFISGLIFPKFFKHHFYVSIKIFT